MQRLTQRAYHCGFPDFDQPASFLQVAADKRLSASLRAVAHGRVMLINLQAWMLSELSSTTQRPLTLYQYVGNDVFRFAGLDRLTGARIEGLDEINGFSAPLLSVG